jgi:hypothetical protein
VQWERERRDSTRDFRRDRPIRQRTFGPFLSALTTAGLAVGTARADVGQTPNATSCPAGYELLSVAGTGPGRAGWLAKGT